MEEKKQKQQEDRKKQIFDIDKKREDKLAKAEAEFKRIAKELKESAEIKNGERWAKREQRRKEEEYKRYQDWQKAKKVLKDNELAEAQKKEAYDRELKIKFKKDREQMANKTDKASIKQKQELQQQQFIASELERHD